MLSPSAFSFGFDSSPTICFASRANVWYSSAACSGAPEMISGVRASSMRMLSTSSTIAKLWSRWKQPSSSEAMLSRR